MTDGADLEDRLVQVESALSEQQRTIDDQQAIIADQQETIADQRERIAALESQSRSGVSRRGALAAGGALGLLGLGATTASADPAGQLGTESRPLQSLYTAELDGPVVDGSDPVTSMTTSADPNSIPRRDGNGEVAVADASSDASAVNRGQDVDWSGQHDFQAMPQVGGSPIVESGSNADGEWTKFADGTFTCFGKHVNKTSGNYAEVRLNLPLTAQTVGFAWAGTDTSTGNDYETLQLMPEPGDWLDSTDRISFRLRTSHGNGVSNRDIRVSYFALGKWA